MSHAITKVARGLLQPAIAQGVIERASRELAEFAQLGARQPQMSRVLSDPDVVSEVKRAFLADLVGDKFHGATVDVIVGLTDQVRCSAPMLTEALADVAAQAVFANAEANGSLAAVEEGLYAFAQLEQSSDVLRAALTDQAVSVEQKISLIADLLDRRTDGRVITLLSVLVALDNGRDVDRRAQTWSSMAASLRDKVVAEVRTAIELDAGRRALLVSVIERRTGKAIEPRFLVDPTVLGSVLVRVEADVYDGSVRHRLEQARISVVGG